MPITIEKTNDATFNVTVTGRTTTTHTVCQFFVVLWKNSPRGSTTMCAGRLPSGVGRRAASAHAAVGPGLRFGFAGAIKERGTILFCERGEAADEVEPTRVGSFGRNFGLVR